MKRKIKTRNGFTLVELLTTLAVIGILLGLLIPALNQVAKTATRVKQKAQFHSIGLGLEAFRNDYGDYPRSEWDLAKYGNYPASQRLAEAMIGWDGFGFHQSSRFRADGKGDIDGDGILDPVAAGATLYDVVGGVAASSGDPAKSQTGAQNLAARKGPYLELESANAVKLTAIYDPGMVSNFPETYVLADMYKQVKNRVTGRQIGMPILYYKANKLKVGNSTSGYDPALGWPNNTYNLGDSLCTNLGLIKIPSPSGQMHFNGNVQANASAFYNAIANPNFPGPPARPYRADSFLLHSAGPDGVYGTMDDMFNFDQDN